MKFWAHSTFSLLNVPALLHYSRFYRRYDILILNLLPSSSASRTRKHPHMIIGNFAPVSVPKLANWRRSVYTWLLVNIQNRFWMNTHGQTSLSGSESHRLSPHSQVSQPKKKTRTPVHSLNPTHMLTNKDLQYTCYQRPRVTTDPSIDRSRPVRRHCNILILLSVAMSRHGRREYASRPAACVPRARVSLHDLIRTPLLTT
jgi:hypothetical protein